MGSFTATELANIANSVLDYHIRGKAIDQIKQVRPLTDELTKRQKTFPGGKEFITVPVRGEYVVTLQGFSHDDTVNYVNPATTKRANFNWFEHHCGIQFTGTELKHIGVSVVDSMTGERTTNHREQDLIELTNALDEKIYDLMEGSMVDFSKLLWMDGTGDPMKLAGVPAFVTTTPATGQTGGIDRALNAWWRNRANIALSVTTPADMAISRAIQQEYRQLRRYNPQGKWRMYGGSAFIDAWEQEARAKGTITQSGWNRQGSIDPSVADISFKDVPLFYEPYLDDLSLSKRMYFLDHSSIFWYVMDGEDWKSHTPARPADKYVFYRALTLTGGMVVKRLNSSGVYAIP